ncbi:hypothetical protein ACFCVO_17700 [Agromyces sp. NPDC056379]|uniref:hypothetical protein n=1 Tax=unclassified Agromyces TaxID=2639701 RepID=UPI0035DABB1D
MITKRVTTFERGGVAAAQFGGGSGRFRADRMLGFALAGLIVVAVGIAGQAQSAEASADLTSARQLAIAEVGGQVGIGAAGVDVAGLRNAAVAHSATEALRSALTAHGEAIAARVAAEAAAAEAAAAEAAAAASAAAEQVADEGDDWSGGSDAAASASGEAAAEPAGAAPAANPYTSEFYPGLPAAPRDEDCGPCTGKEMVPVYYNGSYVWGCDA